jgi:hypothetical protein
MRVYWSTNLHHPLPQSYTFIFISHFYFRHFYFRHFSFRYFSFRYFSIIPFNSIRLWVKLQWKLFKKYSKVIGRKYIESSWKTIVLFRPSWNIWILSINGTSAKIRITEITFQKSVVLLWKAGHFYLKLEEGVAFFFVKNETFI